MILDDNERYQKKVGIIMKETLINIHQSKILIIFDPVLEIRSSESNEIKDR